MSKHKQGMTRRTALGTLAGAGAAAAFGGLATPAIAQQRKISIINADSAEAARQVIGDIAKGFTAATGIAVDVNIMDHESNKTSIRNYLVTSAPEICFWYSGERMRAFAEKGLFEDISDLVTEKGYADILGGTIGSVSLNGRQFGLPTVGRLWGTCYLTSTFDKYGLTMPEDWDGLMAFGENAKDAGLTPLAMGTKELWPAGGFFDILDLRINGLDAHLALMDGKMSYLDSRVAAVFDHWQELIEKGFFLADHTSYGWSDAATVLGRGEAGMMYLASFIERNLPEQEKNNLRLVAFPKIADLPRFEDYSVDSIHIPARAKSKDLAREFLAYFYEPDVFTLYMNARKSVPARNDLPPSDDPLMKAESELLAATAGTAQYYDRDTNPDMAQTGIKGFQEFMAFPDRRQQVLERLEATRKRIYG